MVVVLVVVVVVVVVERPLLPLRKLGLVLERLKLNRVLLPVVPAAVLAASVKGGSTEFYTRNGIIFATLLAR